MSKSSAFLLYTALASASLTAFCPQVAWSAPKAAATPARGTRQNASRPWSVKESVSMRYIVNTASAHPEWPVGGQGNPVISPDGTRFFYVTRHGDLSCDCNRYELRVYDVKAVADRLDNAGASTAPVKPVQVVQMSSAYGKVEHPGIGAPMWEGADAILFLGVRSGKEKSGLFRLDVASGALRRLTPEQDDVTSFDAGGGAILYTVQSQEPHTREDYLRYPMTPIMPVARVSLGDLAITPIGSTRVRITQYAATARGPLKLASFLPAENDRAPFEAQVSPDGRWAVFAAPLDPDAALPAEWSRYPGLDEPRRYMPAQGVLRLWRVNIIDLTTGETRQLLDAPLGDRGFRAAGQRGEVGISWSGDGKTLFVANVHLPARFDTPDRLRMPYLVAYALDTGKVVPLQPMMGAGDKRVLQTDWQDNGLLVTRAIEEQPGVSKRVEGLFYTRAGDGWSAATVPADRNATAHAAPVQALSGGITLSMREGINEAPVPIASRDHRQVPLMEPDPALAGVSLSPWREVEWTDSDGVAEKGLLMLPAGAGKGAQIPLVIVIEGDNGTRFQPDVIGGTAFASQSLASAGIAVLQLRPARPDQSKLTKAERDQKWLSSRIDSAVAQLARQYGIDPARVGLMGFSHTGYLTHMVLTHPGQTRLKAALVAGSTTYGYVELLYDGANALGDAGYSFSTQSAANIYGGPFWANKQGWIDGTPGFNAEKIRTPALFTYNQDAASAPIAETLGAFRLNNKPVDMMLFPGADHHVILPKQREASLGATVDWMRFWLQGFEDPDPAKTERYWWWRKLREQQAANDAKAAAAPNAAQ